MDEILATHAANCANVAKEQIEAVHVKFMAETHAVLKTYDTGQQKQMAGMETDIHQQKQRVTQLEQDNISIKEQIAELQRLAAIAETTPVATNMD